MLDKPLLPWEKLSSEYLYNDTWFTFRKDRVKKGSGKEMYPYYVLEYSNWVNVFPVTTDGKVILQKQYRYGLGQFSIEIPGGVMDPHETDPMEAAKRELLEETGYSCGKIIQTSIISPNPATSNNLTYGFLATDCTLTHIPSFDENEELEVMLASIEEVKELIRENKIIQSLHVTSMMYALMKLGEIKI
jgi:ADP-ribose pyrophosphatase